MSEGGFDFGVHADGDDVEAAVEAMLAEITEGCIEEGSELMMDMCGNAGQESIISDALPDFESACWATFEDGDANPFGTAHDEAVGEIVDAGNQILDNLAEFISKWRDLATSVDAVLGSL